nr:hypothetical protein Iba_chr08cCG7270 [Ipomoea batatas]
MPMLFKLFSPFSYLLCFSICCNLHSLFLLSIFKHSPLSSFSSPPHFQKHSFYSFLSIFELYPFASIFKIQWFSLVEIGFSDLVRPSLEVFDWMRNSLTGRD